MSNEAALAEYEVAKNRREFRAQAAARASADFKAALAAETAAAYAVILSVACPWDKCAAPVGEPCIGESLGRRYRLGRLAQHGVRQDLSGVHGEHNRARQLRKLDV